MEIFIISPDPPTTIYQGTVATVVVTQHPRPDRAVCVISTFVAGQSHLHNSQTAYSAALFTPPADFIDVSGARPRCLPDETPFPPCQLWTGVRLLPHDADVRVHDGLGLHVVIPEERTRAVAASTATELAQAISEGSGDDEVVLFHVAQRVQPSPLSTTEDSIECSCHGVYTCGVNISSNVDEANFYQQTSTTLEQPVLQWNPAMPDPFLEDLAGLWELLTCAWEDEPKEPHCLAPRPVQLYPAIADWRRRIWQAWEDEIIPGAALDYHLVIPKPPTVDHRIIAHVLLVQRQQPRWATMIISVFDARAPDFEVRQLALTFSAQISLDDLLQVMGLYRECTASPPIQRCIAWHHDVTLQRGVPFHAHSGISILMQICDPPQVEPIHMDTDEVATLQLPVKRKLALDELIPEPPRVLVDFTEAARAYYTLMSIRFEFLRDWPENVILPDDTVTAIGTLQIYDDAQLVRAFHFYVDGSKVAGHGVGAATAYLFELDTGYAQSLAGVLPVHVAFAVHAYIEHAAMVNALIWAVHLSTWHLQQFRNNQLPSTSTLMLRTLDTKQLDGGERMNTKNGKPSFVVLLISLNTSTEPGNSPGRMSEHMHNTLGMRWWIELPSLPP